MAQNRQFGSPKARQFGDKAAASHAGDTGNCGQCEAMLADALDGTISVEEQVLFDQHMALCGPCGQLLADARRGAAWLEVLRDPSPEPPAWLLEKILAQTSGAHPGVHVALYQPQLPGTALARAAVVAGASVLAPGYAASTPAGKVVPFRVRASSFAQIMLQPRLAMTAAMAFLSIALTLSLTGVRLQDLRARDLRPASLKRDFYLADARVVQYYEGLRVVYELESRVHDLQSASDNDAAAGTQTTPAPVGQPSPAGPPPAAQPIPRQRPPASRPAPPSGTSRREEIQSVTRRLA